VADLLTAVNAAPGDDVVLLPNHRDVVTSAERAADQSSKHVLVVPTRSILAGLTAATAFNPVLDPDENVRSMKEALVTSRSAEIAVAEPDADTPHGDINREWIGLVDGEVVSAGRSLEEVALAVTRRLVDQSAEVLTLIVGADAHPDDEATVRAALVRAHPELPVESLPGGQPRYPFLIGVE
jgi:fatty acid kinase